MKHGLLNQERSSPQSHSILFTSAISALRNYLWHGGDSRVTRREKQHGEAPRSEKKSQNRANVDKLMITQC